MGGINQNRATPDESSPWKLNGIIVGLNKYASVNPGINEWDLRKINKYSCTSTTVASLPTFPAEPTYVREFREFLQVTRPAVRNLPAQVYVEGLGSLCCRLIMFTVLSIHI